MAATAQSEASEELDERIDKFLADHPVQGATAKEFLGAQFDAGLAWIHFPVGCGGLELSPSLQTQVMRRFQEAKAPAPGVRNLIGYGMVAPTIAVHGTERQRTRYLRPLFTCEEIWCQLFSEPGAGSDVSGLATSAKRDGDVWRINGQKVWTTVAHLSSFGLLLARTDPDQPKHRGLTMFLVDMHADGVDVRPLHQITGEAEFNEVFFTDALISDDDRLGDQGNGWHVALTTLMNERVSIGGQVASRGSGPIGDAVRLFREYHGDDDSAYGRALKDRLMQLWVRWEATRLTNVRASAARKMGTPGPEGSVGKLSYAELNQKVYELCVDLMGANGMLHSSNYPKIRPQGVAIGTPDVTKAFLRVRANSIEGGTSEVMRNILGERVLGLPGEPRRDKDLPWNEVPRN